MPHEGTSKRLPTGIPGLDHVLNGGLLPQRGYVVRGGAGTGKTTLGFHFLTAGTANGEKGLFVTLGDVESKIRDDARTFGFDLTDLPILCLSPPPEFFAKAKSYDIFTAADVEREPITQKIMEAVERHKPQRVFVDAISQLRYLASDPQQFRKQTLAFLHYLNGLGATVLFTSEYSRVSPDDDLRFLSDGVINLAITSHGRTLIVNKFRGSGFQEGRHALRITERGVVVYPRLLPIQHGQVFESEVIPSGIAEFDEMMCGGMERGTTTVITGPSGVGKSTLLMHFIGAAAKRGEHSVVYVLEEPVAVLTRRCESLGIPVGDMVRKGLISLYQVEPHRYMPEEFVGLVRQEVEQRKARIVAIDSISGYRKFLRGDGLLTDLHTLCQYLQNMGMTVFLANEIERIAGGFYITEHGVSYLAGNVVYLRYMEKRRREGVLEVSRCVGILKKRLSDFKRDVRELEFTRDGMKVGGPLIGLRGVLSAMPVLTVGKARPRTTTEEGVG